MNRWKHELNQIAGDFSEQQARLMEGILIKKRKKKKRKTIYTTSIATILVAVLGIFLYQSYQPKQSTTISPPQQVAQQPLKFSTPDEPVYYDEALFMFFKSVSQFEAQSDDGRITPTADPEAIAFEMMISQQAWEYQKTMEGFKFDPAKYAKQLELVKSNFTPAEMQELEEYAKAVNITGEEYRDKVLFPVTVKMALLEQFVGEPIENSYDSMQIIDFHKMFQNEIQALAKELNITYVPREEEFYLDGVVAAVEGRKVLVIVGATKEEIFNLDNDTLSEKYDRFWFTFEEDVDVEVGSTINVEYTDLIVGEENFATGLSIELISE